jgi:hypothetical protein
MSSFSRRIHAYHAATLLGPDNEERKKNILWNTLVIQHFLQQQRTPFLTASFPCVLYDFTRGNM